MQTDRDAPRTTGDERQMLLGFLDYLREAIVNKVDGLADDDARRPMVASGTSLMGLVKHLIRVETAWFPWSFAGEDVSIPDDGLSDGDTVESLVRSYRQACERSNEIVAACGDLDRLSVRPVRVPQLMPLRWVLVHMIEETGRHAGHADILREQIDGSTGR
ncbi:MAG: DinB family protein [Acidimicrobiales bacterium]